MTLASIVEKETGVATERPMVAGLFINRLQAGHAAADRSDDHLWHLPGRAPLARLAITAIQKANEDAYNTYQIDGLPPTPIANPGVAALQAVAHPADTEYLYMMAVTPGDYRDGHYFANDARRASGQRDEVPRSRGAASRQQAAPSEAEPLLPTRRPAQ